MATARAKNVTIQYLACGPLHRFTANSPLFDKEKSDLTETEKSLLAEKLQSFLKIVHKDIPFRNEVKKCLVDDNLRGLLVDWLKVFSGPQPDNFDWSKECIGLLQFIDDLDPTKSAKELSDSGRKLDFLLFIREWFNERTLTRIGTVKRDLRTAPLFMWIRDADANPEAVFVLPSPGTRGFGFRTLDAVLISSFSSTFKHYWDLDPRDSEKRPVHA
jgi:hypothetical protein